MERNEEHRRDESQRAGELQDAELRQSDQSASGADSLVRDDSVLGERHLDDLGDRTERAADRSAEALRNAGGKVKDSVVERNVVHHDDAPTAGDQVGEAAGGISGVLAGAAVGSIGGPIGTVIGGIAGAIGGWWTGRAISEAASNFTHADDAHFRADYESSQHRLADLSYDDVRPAYQLGHVASTNPEYKARDFDEIEGDLRSGWNDDMSRTSGRWEQVRDFARSGYTRGRDTATTGQRGTDVGSEAPAGRDGSSTASSQGGTFGAAASGTQGAQGATFGSFDPSGRQGMGDAPLSSSSTDSAGGMRAADYDNVANRQRSLQSNERGASERPGFTDPVAGEGVENIGSSGLSPRGATGDQPAASNETTRTERSRNQGENEKQY